ncbi:LysR family transcriptional regulator [Methanobacterium aggregans]|uniref:LysR family transcriptional regulator n=1 Tax=Methanobacterium aggregans TaxID=1615586 RepID=UPI001AE4C371|nr:LysR family transcriptional regulator [Methanobacterium aggregans]MBP2046125.1 molybdate transport repressor ModE-like protein [Methanobacterium aggregans]
MDYLPKLNLFINGHEFNYKFFETLECVSKTWSQREAAKRLGVSHAVLNRRIRDAEDKLGKRIVETTGAGSGLTDYGLEILQKYQEYMQRLQGREIPVICGGHISSGLMEVLSSEYGLESHVYRTQDESAIQLAQRDMVDILTFDDPVQAFMRDLDFTPVAYDHLVLVSGGGYTPKSMDDINGMSFVEVPGSSQRLAWNTLDENGVDYRVVELVKSPYEALKRVQKNEDLYTFLNSSFAGGSNVLENETKHIISLVNLNPENLVLKDFIEFVLDEGQQIIRDEGFEPL